jgi:hypothetical protein
MMGTFTATLIEQLKNNGLSITLMVIAVSYFYHRQIKLEEKVDLQQKEIVLYLKEDRISLQKTVGDNTAVLTDVQKILTRLDGRLK